MKKDGNLFCACVGVFAVAASACLGDVSAWQIPAGLKMAPDARQGWTVAVKGADRDGLVLENENILVGIQPGSETAVVYIKAGGCEREHIDLAVSGNGGAGKIGKVTYHGNDGGEGRATVSTATGDINLSIGPGSVHVKIVPGKGASFLCVRAPMPYAALPDFFAYDTLLSPDRFQGERVGVPAETFLMGFVEGGNTMLMCVFPGQIAVPSEDAAAPKHGREPAVEMVLGESGGKRVFSGVNLEFAGCPIYVAALGRPGIWHAVDTSDWNAQWPYKIEWKRPFDAAWRADMLSKKGWKSQDFMTESISYGFSVTGTKGRWKQVDGITYAETCQQGLWPYYMDSAWFDKSDTWLALYADRGARKQNKTPRKDAGVPGMFDVAVIYPLDRSENTPLDVMTPTDVMRNTLGKGPCEYVLDLDGLERRETDGFVTCWARDQIKGLLRKKPMDAKTQARIAELVGGMGKFIHGVRKRIDEYAAFSKDAHALCEEYGVRNDELKTITGDITKTLAAMDRAIATVVKRGDGEFPKWDKSVPEMVAKIEAGDVKAATGAYRICPFAESQDVTISLCRRFVRAINGEMLLRQVNTPEAREFIDKLRDRIQRALRSRHTMESP